jgi:hypothetical protein
MALSDPAHGRVAGHLGNQVDVQREQGGLQPHAGRGHGCLAAGVSSADHDDIVLFGKLLHSLNILQVRTISRELHE